MNTQEISDMLGFEKVADLPAGNLVVHYIGSDFSLPYLAGSAFVNKNGSVGYVALNCTQITGEKIPFEFPEHIDARKMMALHIAQGLGGTMVELLTDKEMQTQIKEFLEENPIILCYSRSQTGQELMTIPHIKSDANPFSSGTVFVRPYALEPNAMTLQQVYSLHVSGLNNQRYRDLIHDKNMLKDALVDLPAKAQSAYKIILESIK